MTIKDRHTSDSILLQVRLNLVTVNMLNTVFLQCLGLLFFCESLCVAGPQHETSHGSNATYLKDDLILRFQFWSNSPADCSLALSKPGVSVAVSYRTDPDSENWILLEPINATTPDASCKR